jgi:hypothetical protein
MASIKSLIDAFDVNTTNRALVSALRAFSRTGGCGRLTKSGSNLLFSPFNGNLISINGNFEEIPDAGVTLGVGGLSASTTYRIYAFMSAGTLTLEASTTVHATQAGTGIEIKSGDATRTLVGMARTNGSTAWEDSATKRLVLSWFNRRAIHGRNGFAADRTTASGSARGFRDAARAWWPAEDLRHRPGGGCGPSAEVPGAEARRVARRGSCPCLSATQSRSPRRSPP